MTPGSIVKYGIYYGVLSHYRGNTVWSVDIWTGRHNRWVNVVRLTEDALIVLEEA